jgi:hypothetical protein
MRRGRIRNTASGRILSARSTGINETVIKDSCEQSLRRPFIPVLLALGILPLAVAEEVRARAEWVRVFLFRFHSPVALTFESARLHNYLFSSRGGGCHACCNPKVLVHEALRY